MIKQVIGISAQNTQQGTIDWQRVRASGVEGVMLRVGKTAYNGDVTKDAGLDSCIQAASAQGLWVGLYVEAHTKNPAAAHRAADQMVRLARQHPDKINMPLAFCVQDTQSACLISQGKEGLTDSVIAFLFEVSRQGYRGMFYTDLTFAKTHLNLERLFERDIWIADPRGDQDALQRDLGRDWCMWEYTGAQAVCDGVPNGCARSRCSVDFL
ncbi:MAG: GH25 family lysozyme [Candidatus Fimivivens sp.]